MKLFPFLRICLKLCTSLSLLISRPTKMVPDFLAFISSPLCVANLGRGVVAICHLYSMTEYMNVIDKDDAR